MEVITKNPVVSVVVDDFYDVKGGGAKRVVQGRQVAPKRVAPVGKKPIGKKTIKPKPKAPNKSGIGSHVIVGGTPNVNISTSTPEPKKGMSMGVKIGIGVGIAVVLGVIGLVVYKKMKNKKK